MKLRQIIKEFHLTEANVARKINDPKTMKMLRLAIRHDRSIPKHKLAALGPRPSDEEILELWSKLLDDSLSNTDFGDISRDGKFDLWLTRLYINGHADFEDINGEGGDALGSWKVLSRRDLLKPEHQDFNRFKTLKQIQRVVRDSEYRDVLRKIRDAEVIEKHKREKKETTLIDDGRFLVTLPYNYGACYTFNNAAGYNASFCTGSSSGLSWFQRYAPDGPVISVFDKENADESNGKWQMHAPTRQMNNGDQTIVRTQGDMTFAELFPGLLKRIIAAIQSKSEEIQQNSTELTPGGYDVDKETQELKHVFPYSYNSEADADADTDNVDNDNVNRDEELTRFRVRHRPTGRTAVLTGNDVQDVQIQLQTGYPTIDLEDFEIVPEQNW